MMETLDDTEPARRRWPRGLVPAVVLAAVVAVIFAAVVVTRSGDDAQAKVGSLKTYEGTVGFAQAAQPAVQNPASFGLEFGPHGDPDQVSGIWAGGNWSLPHLGEHVRAVLWTPPKSLGGSTVWVAVTPTD